MSNIINKLRMVGASRLANKLEKLGYWINIDKWYIKNKKILDYLISKDSLDTNDCNILNKLAIKEITDITGNSYKVVLRVQYIRYTIYNEECPEYWSLIEDLNSIKGILFKYVMNSQRLDSILNTINKLRLDSKTYIQFGEEGGISVGDITKEDKQIYYEMLEIVGCRELDGHGIKDVTIEKLKRIEDMIDRNEIELNRLVRRRLV